MLPCWNVYLYQGLVWKKMRIKLCPCTHSWDVIESNRTFSCRWKELQLKKMDGGLSRWPKPGIFVSERILLSLVYWTFDSSPWEYFRNFRKMSRPAYNRKQRQKNSKSNIELMRGYTIRNDTKAYLLPPVV